MTGKLKLPMGIEDFETIRKDGFYYVDKTRLMKDLLEYPAHVNLFTRPRRFGKTLNMSMLKCFFEIGTDSTLFDGLKISKDKAFCNQYMGKFPVLSVSLKNVESDTFEAAKKKICFSIGNEASGFLFLAQSDRLSEIDRRQYEKITELNERGEFSMSDELLENSLFILSRLLHKHYGQKVIILIDEYDVPLDKAYQSGYYDAMLRFMKALFGQALKTNSSLYFAVLTGCLRISKESIFTGLNNFKVYTVKEVRYKEYFGFTDAEVREMLLYYGFMSRYDVIKEWYDGYRFGNLSIYCPWDVINYCSDLTDENATEPQNYWVNTSSNDIVRRFVERADAAAKDEIEQLINGGTVRKEIRQELTYRDLDSDLDNLWSLLFTTGYLTQAGKDDRGQSQLTIPNREIKWIYVQQIRKWFKDETKKDSLRLESFCRAFLENDTAAIEEGFSAYLRKTISIRDADARKERKENFYHGILLGLFGSMPGWKVRSNAESGEGYSDISVEAEETGIIIELKYAEHAAFDDSCRKALDQIRDRGYEEALLDDGMKTVYRYGIACYKKRCKVISG